MAKRSENFNFLSTMKRFCKRNLLATKESWTSCSHIDFSGLETGCCKYGRRKLLVNLSPFVFTPVFDESISRKIFSVIVLFTLMHSVFFLPLKKKATKTGGQNYKIYSFLVVWRPIPDVRAPPPNVCCS